MLSSLLLFFLLIVISLVALSLAIRSSESLVERATAHWCHSLNHLEGSPQEFYSEVRALLEAQEIPGVKMEVISWHEGGILSDKRDYLRIRRDGYIYDLCAAPFGAGFFVSSWFSEKPQGVLEALLGTPVVGVIAGALIRLFNPMTYYRVDAASMFQGAVHNAVLEVIDRMSAIQGVPPLTELQRKPVMKELYGTGKARALPAF